MGDEGIKHICSALQKNRGTRLKTLYIYKNAITDEGLQAVADLVQSNTSLTDIVAYHNNFSEKAVDAFIPALEVNHSLLRVDLYFGGWRVIPRTDVDAILNR